MPCILFMSMLIDLYMKAVHNILCNPFLLKFHYTIKNAVYKFINEKKNTQLFEDLLKENIK